MADTFRHIQTVKPDDAPFATRPDYGSQSTIPLSANYYKMFFKDLRLVFHLYTISLEPFTADHQPIPQADRDAPRGKKLMQIIRCALDTLTFRDVRSEIATDFSNTLISCKKLENRHLLTDPFEYWAENDIAKNGRPRPRSNAICWQMSLEPNTQLPISNLLERKGSIETVAQIIQALDTVLYHRNKLSLESVTPKHGKCFPVKPDIASQHDLGYLKFVRGFFASVRATADRPLLNCNACYGAFHNVGNLATLFDQVLPPFYNVTDQDHKRLESTIQGLRVELIHLDDKSVRTVFGLARRNHRYADSREALVFDEDDQVEITVSQYWDRKNYDVIKNKTLPVVNVGDKRNPFHVPAQVCEILPGQLAKKKLEGTEIEAMIKFARRDPEQTRNAINKDAFRVLGFLRNTAMESFGIDLSKNMETVNSRVLARPTIVYSYHSNAQIGNKGRWNMANQQVIKPGRTVKYGIMSITSNGVMNSLIYPSFEAFRKTLCKTLDVLQIEFKHLPAIRTGDENALKKVFRECQTYDIGLLVVVLPSKDASLYRMVKRLGDTEYGIDTICVVGDRKKFYNLPPTASNDRQPNAQYHANLALKINLKLGGQNHKLGGDKQKLEEQNRFYKNTMVIGIDVTHPSPGPTKRTAPSVAAMAASIDGELSQWLVDLRINTAGREMVELIGPMLRTRLEVWQRKSKLPSNLLIYRDGVSESQYEAVLRGELAAMLNTCKTMYVGTPLPKITLIVVGKRHHTRFFDTRRGGSENPVFGTVVDSGVTEARNWDFYLQSHHALMGTARPAHYFVLLNQIFDKELVGPRTGISDYLHQLTYELCYLFGRSTGPVSIPPPVYYAHLACERSRCYGDFDDVISDTSSELGDDRSKPGFSGSVTQLPLRSQGSGKQAEKQKPGPSSQGPTKKTGDAPKKEFRPAESKKTEDAPEKDPLSAAGKLPDVSGLSRKQRAKLHDERLEASMRRQEEASKKRREEAASQRAAGEGSSKTEEKKAASKAEAKKPENKGEAKKGEEKAEGKKLQGKPEEQMPEPQAGQKSDTKAQGKKSKSEAEGQKPDPKAEVKKPESKGEAKDTETKAQGTKPQAKPKDETLKLQAEQGGSSKAQAKKPQSKAETQKPETIAQEEEPQTKAQGKRPESKAIETPPESKAEGKKPASKAEGRTPQSTLYGEMLDAQIRTEGRKPGPSPYEVMFDARVEALLPKEEKNIIKIHDRLKDTMFFV